MKTLNLIIALMLSIEVASAQSGFRAFLESFPNYTSWDKLPEDIRNIKPSKKELDADTLNKYCFPRFYFSQQPGHDPKKKYPSPMRMDEDGKSFFKGDEGAFSNLSVINMSDRKVTINFHLYPLARVQISDSICMVFLLYDGPGANDNFLSKNFYYEAYTFNTRSETVLSVITLFKDGELLFSYITKDRILKIYEEVEFTINDDGDVRSAIVRGTFYLRDDGFLQRVINESLSDSKIVAKFRVVDPDGFTNVREKPTTQSPILYTIKTGFGGLLEITDNPNWYRVIYSNDGIVSPNKNAHINGWIHKSRVCFRDGIYGWHKGDPNVCK